MNNKQVAEKFANGGTSGKGSHLFIEGDTIYSYGYHFPVATRTPKGVLVTCRSYSVSTARHISKVKAALNYEYKLAGAGDGRAPLTPPTSAEIAERAAAAVREEERFKKSEARRAAKASKLAQQSAA